DNGGPTQTLLLQGGSPAQGAGIPEICPATDQRGEPRDSPCDAGAVETAAGPMADAGAAVLALAQAAVSGDPADLAAAEAALGAAIGL
ncbi:MAG: hypothetical protein KC466_20030, partial [Myxococcales bacterium]|nr:hypothetical protein [Myxococcales bacterium]